MRSAALYRELSCECCAQELDILHDVLVTSDISIAKALMISEVAQIARLEMRTRDYLTGKWLTRAREASARAGAVVAGGGSVTAAYAAVDKVMEKWAGEVESRVTTDLASIYKLSRVAAWKKATGRTRASLQYIVPNFTEELEAGRELVKKAKGKRAEVAEALPSLDLLDDAAVKDLQDDQMMWIGRHYRENLREAVRNAVKPGMIEGAGHRVAGKSVASAIEKVLGKVVVPDGFHGSAAKYFEGIAANTATNARVRGQVRSFRDVGITKYEIVNPMDTRTTPICAFMNGQTFTTKDADEQMERTSAATTPGGVKRAHPWLSIVKIKTIFKKGGSRGLAKAGLALPPYHFRCRSTVDVSIESMSFDSLDRGVPYDEPGAKPKAVPAAVPSTRMGELGEKIFGRKLTDAEIDDLTGLKAKLPPGHSLVVSVRESTKRERVTIGAGIIDKAKNIVGSFSRDYTRTAGKTNVKHAAFFIDEKSQNLGIGRSLFNAQVDAYVKQGINKVSLDAAEIGKYVWTKAGFEWTKPAQIKAAFEQLRAQLESEIGAKAAKKALLKVRTPEDIARLVVGKKRIGKKFLIDLANDDGDPNIEMSQIPARIKRL